MPPITPLQSASEPALLQKGIELVAGTLLLVGGYYALLSRRTADDDRRHHYRRMVLRMTTGFLVFAYSTAILVPETSAWPVTFGHSIRGYFQHLDAAPAVINGELTGFYTAIMEQVGVVTTTADPADDPVDAFLTPIRTVGLVVYTIFFSATSLGLHVPRRLIGAIGATSDGGE